jgi:hypothetical protein
MLQCNTLQCKTWRPRLTRPGLPEVQENTMKTTEDTQIAALAGEKGRHYSVGPPRYGTMPNAGPHAGPPTGSADYFKLAVDRLLELVAAESLRADAASFGWRPWARAQARFWASRCRWLIRARPQRARLEADRIGLPAATTGLGPRPSAGCDDGLSSVAAFRRAAATLGLRCAGIAGQPTS